MNSFLTYLRQELKKTSREASPNISKTLDTLIYLIDLEEQVSNQVDDTITSDLHSLENRIKDLERWKTCHEGPPYPVMTVEEKRKELAPYMEKTDAVTRDIQKYDRWMEKMNRLEDGLININNRLEKVEKWQGSWKG